MSSFIMPRKAGIGPKSLQFPAAQGRWRIAAQYSVLRHTYRYQLRGYRESTILARLDRHHQLGCFGRLQGPTRRRQRQRHDGWQ